MLDFQRNIKELEKKNVQVVAASADPLEQALKTFERYKLTFKVGYGLDPRGVSSLTGAFFNDKEGYLQAAGFVIGPDHKVANAVYSSNSIGRLVAKDCIDFVEH